MSPSLLPLTAEPASALHHPTPQKELPAAPTFHAPPCATPPLPSSASQGEAPGQCWASSPLTWHQPRRPHLCQGSHSSLQSRLHAQLPPWRFHFGFSKAPEISVSPSQSNRSVSLLGALLVPARRLRSVLLTPLPGTSLQLPTPHLPPFLSPSCTELPVINPTPLHPLLSSPHSRMTRYLHPHLSA